METTGNGFAIAAILAWPAVALYLYSSKNFIEASLWTILGALLFLPAGGSLKLAMIPALDKNTVPNLCLVMGSIFFGIRRQSRPSFGIASLLITGYIFSPLATSLLNGDDITYGNAVVPGVGLYDGISAAVYRFLSFLPFLIGRSFINTAMANEKILRALVVAGLVYSVPMLFELRMSPVLSTWVYGYFSSAFINEFRDGSFRPIVFMTNGLVVAFFVSTTFLAAVTLWRTKLKFMIIPTSGAAAYLGIMLILCKSAGSLVYGIFGGAFICWISPKWQIRIAAVLVSVAVLYPTLRIAQQFPDQLLVDVASQFSAERADSLKIRFEEEERLIAHTNERFLFGWGRYGRNRLHDESGRDVSATDGHWIITFSQYGIVGFLLEFGLLAWPIFRTASAFKFVQSMREQMMLAGLVVICALTVIEQLPNDSLSPWSWLLVGSLLGRAETLNAMARSTSQVKRVFFKTQRTAG